MQKLMFFVFMLLINYCFSLPLPHRSSLLSANLSATAETKSNWLWSSETEIVATLKRGIEATELTNFPCFREKFGTVRESAAYTAFLDAIVLILKKHRLNEANILKHFTVTIGNHQCEKLWHFESASGVTENTALEIYSASKWLSGVALLAALYDPIWHHKFGDHPLDKKICDFIPYWECPDKAPDDRRATITFKHLLSFTSGFHVGKYEGLYEYNCKGISLKTCVEEKIYGNEYFTNNMGVPGEKFEYNLIHLQIAGAAIESATVTESAPNMCFANLIRKYVFVPAEMTPRESATETPAEMTNCVNYPKSTGTYFGANDPPSLGGAFGYAGPTWSYAGIKTTPRYYNKFLHHYLQDNFTNSTSFNYFNSTLREIMETVPFAVTADKWEERWPVKQVEDSRQFALSHWVKCNTPYNARGVELGAAHSGGSCLLNNTHHSSGAKGFYPLVNRRYNFTLLIGYQSPNANMAVGFLGGPVLAGNKWSTKLSDAIGPVLSKLFESHHSLSSKHSLSTTPSASPPVEV